MKKYGAKYWKTINSMLLKFSMLLLKEIRSCDICAGALPFAPRPLLQLSRQSSILLIGQAPGLQAHQEQRPWCDKSGDRLRQWLNLSGPDFYNPRKLSIVPMGFCYPGRYSTGDLPPRKECRIRWMDTILSELKGIELKILVGKYAIEYFMGPGKLESQIKLSFMGDGQLLALPHPSPRNNIWLAKHGWFERDYVPELQRRLQAILS
jgi:uracil-DNA glycosylase